MTKREPSRASSTPPLLIVVDDDARIRQSFESLLQSAGICFQLCSSAAEALASDLLPQASCLITDIRMPGMDGWELQRHAALLHPRLPVIFVTAHHDEVARDRALSLGAFAFFYKPFDGEDLLHTVAAALTSYSTADLRGEGDDNSNRSAKDRLCG